MRGHSSPGVPNLTPSIARSARTIEEQGGEDRVFLDAIPSIPSSIGVVRRACWRKRSAMRGAETSGSSKSMDAIPNTHFKAPPFSHQARKTTYNRGAQIYIIN